eukprot:TRINITY_DN8589_c0_g1_i2.p1 TRINITY_DN8589_c0_g1~~TRINITY_DN8589_c0_g1_i2.p1  ORF type:complete len:541 (+),score=93.03 TRINITY_DN8589_c0_g1_i2:147-1769(+)
MSMLDAFFNKGFKAAKCKTLLKLTIPRIKLLRNRREIQLKQMRKDIAKLLETGQEATARIRVEHIIREENMMAAQEIIELFCELITVRLPIIESQRECPLDLKEAISSICFAAPRCSDLPELLQVQMLFVSKYGREFVLAATELMPDCGVNRQIIELLSVRAPSAETKLKLLKEIAEEHELDWDPAASETELLKPHEDLLNGPTQFTSGSRLPLPKEKHDESLSSIHVQAPYEPSDSDTGFDSLDLPEVPKVLLRPNSSTVSAPEAVPHIPASPDSEIEESTPSNKDISYETFTEPDVVVTESQTNSPRESVDISVSKKEEKQFLPFVSLPSVSSTSFSTRQNEPARTVSRPKSKVNTDLHTAQTVSRTQSEVNVDLQDVLAAAHAAAESAERAAAAARSAASLAQVRITELITKKNDPGSDSVENPFHMNSLCQPVVPDMPAFDRQQSLGDTDGSSHSLDSTQDHERTHGSDALDHLSCSCNTPKMEYGNPLARQPQRLTSLEDDTYFSYPNLFTSQDSKFGSGIHASGDNSRSPTSPD